MGAAARIRRLHIALWHGSGAHPGDAHGDVDPRLLRITIDEVVAAADTLTDAHAATG